MKTFKELCIIPEERKSFTGDKIKIDKLLNRQITVLGFRIEDSKYTNKCLYLQIVIGDTKRVLFTGSKKLQHLIQQTTAESFPFTTTIVKEDDDSYNFT